MAPFLGQMAGTSHAFVGSPIVGQMAGTSRAFYPDYGQMMNQLLGETATTNAVLTGQQWQEVQLAILYSFKWTHMLK